jgi:hypothetical protein
VLCVLAALFAIEAKLAWYGPDSSPASHISASKLQPTEAPRLVAQAIASSDSIAHFPAVLQIIAVSLVMGATPVAPRSADVPPVRLIAVGFSPQAFFRPPPSL